MNPANGDSKLRSGAATATTHVSTTPALFSPSWMNTSTGPEMGLMTVLTTVAQLQKGRVAISTTEVFLNTATTQLTSLPPMKRAPTSTWGLRFVRPLGRGGDGLVTAGPEGPGVITVA